MALTERVHSVLRAPCAAVLIVLPLLFAVLQGCPNTPNQADSADVKALAEESVAKVNLTMAYPSTDSAGFDRAADLANSFASSVGFGPLTAFFDNSHNLSTAYTDNASEPFIGFSYPSYHWGAWGSDGTRIWTLYNANDTLVQIKAYQSWRTGYVLKTEPTGNQTGVTEVNWIDAVGGWKAQDANSYISTARSLASAIGIPSEMIPEENESLSMAYDPESGQEMSLMTVTLWRPLGGAQVKGVNSLIVGFFDLNVSSILLYPFYNASGDIAYITKDSAVQAAESFILSDLADLNVTILRTPSYYGMGFDQETMSVVYILDGGVKVSDWPYSAGVIVIVDAQTGDGISERVIRAVPDIYRPTALKGGILVLVGVASVVGVTTIFLVVWTPELLTLAIFGLLMPLYSRLRKDEVLDQYKRGMIHGFVIAHPGASFSEIRRSLSIANGTLVYHLDVLVRSGHISSRRSGNLMRYYDGSISFADMSADTWTELQRKIISHVSACGECSKADLRRSMGITRQTLHYNIKKLETDRVLVRGLTDGRRSYRLSPGFDAQCVGPAREDSLGSSPGT
jgi:predicted transcriptional regulator